MDSDDEYHPQGSDDNDSDILPEISIPSLTPTKSKRNAGSLDEQGQGSTPKRYLGSPPPLIRANCITMPDVSPAKAITKKEVTQSVRDTQKLAMKVQRLNEECVKQEERNKIDSMIKDVLVKGGIVGLEEERQQKLLEEAKEANKPDPSDLQDDIDLLQLPSMMPEGIPFFVNPPDPMCLLDPPPLVPTAEESKLEELLRNADHPQLNELIQGDMVAFWYKSHRCPSAVMEWLLRVACLFNDAQLSSSACRTLCSLMTSSMDHLWELNLRSLQEIVQQLGGVVTVPRNEEDSQPHETLEKQSLIPVSTPGSSQRIQLLRNLAVIVCCFFQSKQITLTSDEVLKYLNLLLNILLDPLVLCKPLECNVVSALDAFVSSVPEGLLKPAIISSVSSLLPSISNLWDKMYIAHMLALTSICWKTLRRVFCLACLKKFVDKKSEDERRYLAERKLPDIAELSLEELCTESLSKVLCSFVVIFNAEYIVSMHFEGFYPLFQVFWVASKLIKYDSCPQEEIRELLDEIYHLSGRVRDTLNSVWPTVFKDLLTRIINTVNPGNSLVEECLSS
jgi:hypothetical protein